MDVNKIVQKHSTNKENINLTLDYATRSRFSDI